jgi:hypothetical protein
MPEDIDAFDNALRSVINKRAAYIRVHNKNPSKVHVYVNQEMFYKICSSPNVQMHIDLRNNEVPEIYGAKLFIVTASEHPPIEILIE